MMMMMMMMHEWMYVWMDGCMNQCMDEGCREKFNDRWKWLRVSNAKETQRYIGGCIRPAVFNNGEKDRRRIIILNYENGRRLSRREKNQGTRVSG